MSLRIVSSALTVVFAARAAAQSGGAGTSSVTSLFFLQADQQPLVASVVGANPTATTYSLACPSGTDGSECGFAGGVTITAAPTAWDMNYVVPASLLAADSGDDSSSSGASSSSPTPVTGTDTLSAHCTMSNNVPGLCTQIGSGPDVPGGTSAETSTPQSSDYGYLTVTITAGLDKLASASASPTASGSGNASTTGSAKASGSQSGSAASGSSASHSGSSASSSAQATGAANQNGISLVGAVVGIGAAAVFL